MEPLNLPAFDHQVKKIDGKFRIFDVLRKKYLVLTPEEWVRQHFVHYMISTLKYPKPLIKVEGGLVYNQLARRSDIAVFDRSGKYWMIVECKSPDVVVNEVTLTQASVYNSVHKAPYLALTNGMLHYAFAIDWENNTTKLLSGMPAYGED